MPKILILAGDAAESLEVMYPYQRLLEEGYDVEIAAPTKKKLQFVVHDFVDGYDTYTEKPGYTWDADLAFADVDPTEYAAVVIPACRAPEYIRNDPDFQRIVPAASSAGPTRSRRRARPRRSRGSSRGATARAPDRPPGRRTWFAGRGAPRRRRRALARAADAGARSSLCSGGCTSRLGSHRAGAGATGSR